MGRIKPYLLVVLMLFVLTACSANKVQTTQPDGHNTTTTTLVDGPDTFTAENDDFRIKTTINKITFKQEEVINLYSTIEYIGSNENISIWSGEPYFHHTIYKGNECINGEITHTILKNTVLQKGEVYTIAFSKNGGFDPNDPNAEFLKQYLADKELKLPAGEYTFTAKTAFAMDQEQKEKVLLKNEFTVKVY